MKNKLQKKWLLSFFILFIILISSCKKNNLETAPEGTEILFDHKDGSSMGYEVGGKWNKNNITWYVEKWCNSLSTSETREMLIISFKNWSDVSNLRFTEVSNIGQADIVISFGDNKHWTNVNNRWCPDNFNVVYKNYGVLAHTFYPPSQPLAGDIHFCDLHKWSPYGEANNSSISLLSVATHEIGHAIGINHSTDINSIMYPRYDPQDIKYSLGQDDINAVIFLYGANVNQNSIISITGSCPAEVQTNSYQTFVMTIHNTGTKKLNITDFNISSNTGAFSFFYGKPTFPLVIQPNGSYNVTLKFAPQYSGIHNSNFVVISDANLGDNFSSLTGNGVNNCNNLTICPQGHDGCFIDANGQNVLPCDWTINACNGSPPYQYKLDNGSYSSNNLFSVYSHGDHTFYAKDANGCVVSETVTF